MDKAVEVSKAFQLVTISNAVDGLLKKGGSNLDDEAECENPQRDDSVQIEGSVVDGDRFSPAHLDDFIQEVQHIFVEFYL